MAAMAKFVFVLFVAIIAYYVITDQKLNPDDVQGLRVVVTGASYGIGREVARQMAQMGAKILVTARTESKLKKVVEECKGLGSPDAYYVPADMTDVGSAKVVIDEALKKLGGIDVLVLNHVGGVYFTLYDDIAAMIKMFQSNTISYAQLTSRAMNSLQKNKGRVAVVSSVAGLAGTPSLSHYSASKAALNVYYRSLDLELQRNNSDVSVSIFHLGVIDTDTGRKNVGEKPAFAPTSEKDCSSEIIRGTMSRQREIYIPSYLLFFRGVYGLVPGVIRRIVLHVTDK